MKQKFRKLSFVRVCDVMPPEMAHFEAGIDAIVEGTYSQLYGGSNVEDYALYILKKGKVVDQIAWYREDQLSLLPVQDRDKAEEMIEEFNLRQKRPK